MNVLIILLIISSKYKAIGSGYRDVTSDEIIPKLTDKSFLYFANLIEKYFNAMPMPFVVFKLSRIAGAKSPRSFIQNPAETRDSGLYWISLDGNLVEAAGIEPASVNPPRTGDYMLSLSLI